MKRPEWLDKKVNLRILADVQGLCRNLRLHTVCEQALCPNIGECFSRNVATFLILGDVCTRWCSFCAVSKGKPLPPDPDEPERVATALKTLGIRYAVITSVTRDDLPDAGAGMFAETAAAIRRLANPPAVELLIPDFRGDTDCLRRVVEARPDVLSHNVETVPRLYETVRAGSDYPRSIALLRKAKDMAAGLPTKSGIMLGLGETREEVVSVMKDLVAARCEILTIGQYLAPGRRHYPVQSYVRPEEFEEYRAIGLSLGFLRVTSGPYVRSSYLADQPKMGTHD